jgi:hypothetical protein
MRCKDALVSTVNNRNLGCGEWDFSCNTYLVDSTKVESAASTTPSHVITNFDGTIFPYISTPVYDIMRGTQIDARVINVSNEVSAEVGVGNDMLTRVLSTDNKGGKSYYLYTADELLSGGLSAGMIHGLSMPVIEGGETNFLKIKMQNSSKTELNGLIDEDSFTEVYYKNSTLVAGTDNRFQFHEPFMWDGSSNVIVEFTFTNIDTPLAETIVEGETVATSMGMSAVNESELMLLNNAYIETDEYTGVSGTQNRTIEAWVKTDNGRNGEIFAWGTGVTGSKYVLRFTNGALRLEVSGGGTVGTTRIDDGEWHHIACVLDGDNLGDIVFYIDGVLDTNSAIGNTPINTADGKVRISRGLNNRYFDASIDDIRIWDTNLSAETINEWKNLKVTDAHPNYNNLQLYFEFNGEGDKIVDSSPFGRDATLFGERYSYTGVGGAELYRDFVLSSERPTLTFYQGNYNTEITRIPVDRPIAKNPRHLVQTRTIEETDPQFAIDDRIVSSEPREYWAPNQRIFDEETGDFLTQIALTPEGEFVITDLDYTRRFPFYNELMSFVTPYGINLDLGEEGVSWVFDMSDYASILQGDKRLLITLGGQNQEEMDLEFQFIVGTPPRDVVQYEQIWQGTNRIGIAQISQILNDDKFSPRDITLTPDAAEVKIRSSVTGHGSEGEFQQNGGFVSHILRIDDFPIFSWRIHKECSFNPIYPQGGTWVFDRQGWCPGERTLITEHNLTPYSTPGEIVNIDYTTTAPQVSTGDYRYHVAHQLVAYGEPNFQTDASIVGVAAPNNSAEYTRVGTICDNPQVIIRNTGAENLTNLTINYWINDAQSPQTYEWTGNLEFMEEEVVTIPSPPALWFDILSDNNKFHAEILAPNGGVDEYSFNNTFTSDFDYPDVLPSDITIEFKTNTFSSENRYELVDGDGNVIGSNTLPAINTIYNDDYNLANGCYTLRVTDTGGDGLQWFANPNQGSGFINIRDNNGTAVKSFDPDFGGGFDFSFSTTFPVSTEELEFLTSLEVFPNPASDFCTLIGDDLSDAHISIVNYAGQTMTTDIQSRHTDLITLNISLLDAGIYFVVIEKDHIRTTRRIVVK